MLKKVITIMFTLSLMAGMGCENPVSEKTGVVSFGTADASQTGISAMAATAGGVGTTGLTKVVVSIEKAAGGAVLTDKVIPLTNFGGNVLSENLVLPIGSYKLTKFLLQDSAGNTQYAAPLAGSAKAYLVAAPLPLTFTVADGASTSVKPEVITTKESVAGDFGYAGLDFTVVAVFDFLAQVQIAGPTGYVNTTADISIKEGAKTYFTGALTAGVNKITLNDGGTAYTVAISKDGYATQTATYTLAQMKAFLQVPLFVTLVPASFTGYSKVTASTTNGGGGLTLRYTYANGTTQDVQHTLYATTHQVALNRTDVTKVEYLSAGGSGTPATHTVYFSIVQGEEIQILVFQASTGPANGTVLWTAP